MYESNKAVLYRLIMFFASSLVYRQKITQHSREPIDAGLMPLDLSAQGKYSLR